MSKLSEKALIISAYEADKVKPIEVKPNDHPRIREYLKAAGIGVPAPWCAAFVVWCVKQALKALNYPSTTWEKYYPTAGASVCNWRQWAVNNGFYTADPSKVSRGDLFLWCDKAKWQGHMGWVAEIKKLPMTNIYVMRTIEGNSSDDPNDREGTKIVRRGWLNPRRHTNRIEYIRFSKLN